MVLLLLQLPLLLLLLLLPLLLLPPLLLPQLLLLLQPLLLPQLLPPLLLHPLQLLQQLLLHQMHQDALVVAMIGAAAVYQTPVVLARAIATTTANALEVCAVVPTIVVNFIAQLINRPTAVHWTNVMAT